MTDENNQDSNDQDGKQVYVVGIYSKGLKVAPDDVRMPGEELPEAHTWKAHVLQANLNMKYIQTKEEYAMQKKHDKALEKARQEAKKKKQEDRAKARAKREYNHAKQKQAHLALNGQDSKIEDHVKIVPAASDKKVTKPLTPEGSNPVNDKLAAIDSHAVLKDIAEGYKLSKGGGKEAIRARIREHEATLNQ